MATHVQSSNLNNASKELEIVSLGLGFTLKSKINHDEPTSETRLSATPATNNRTADQHQEQHDI
jgi:hypothetical protein